jgi:hypothetical protein
MAVAVQRFQQRPRELYAAGISWCINGMLATVPVETNFNGVYTIAQNCRRTGFI